MLIKFEELIGFVQYSSIHLMPNSWICLFVNYNLFSNYFRFDILLCVYLLLA
jgi:hypothetical protein